MVYILNIGGEENNKYFIIILCIGISYPFMYDNFQMLKQGTSYWDDPWNYSDFLLIWSGLFQIGNLAISGPYELHSRLVMIIMVFGIL